MATTLTGECQEVSLLFTLIVMMENCTGLHVSMLTESDESVRTVISDHTAGPHLCCHSYMEKIIRLPISDYSSKK